MTVPPRGSKLTGDRTVLITGGNCGIGEATATALASMGARVVITSRNRAKGEQALQRIREQSKGEVSCLPLDLGSLSSVRECAAQFLETHGPLHVLINNAGVLLKKRTVTQDGFETTFAVNHLGHFLFTELLLDRIRQSAPARIINLSSNAHFRAIRGLDFDDLQSEKHYDGFVVYAKSKLANIYFTIELAQRLSGTKVTVNSVHPGTVATRFAADGDSPGVISWFFRLGKPFLRTPEEGADTSVFLASSPVVAAVTGEYFMDRKPHRVSSAARNPDAAKTLWTISERLVAERA